MIARQALRTIQPLKKSVAASGVRHYATQGASGGSSNTILYGGIAAATAALGGYYYFRSSDKPLQPAQTAGKVNPPSTRSGSSITLASDSKPLNSTFTGGEQGWISLKLESVEKLSHNTNKFRFSLPNPDDVSGLQVASALLTKYQGPGTEKVGVLQEPAARNKLTGEQPVIRPYTPTSDEDAKGFIELVVKKYPDGPMSSHIHSMKPEQRLDFKGPIPKYPWSPNKHNHIALIAGGTGITPMYQLARAIFKNPDDKTKVTLVFGNVKEEDILLRSEFQELENTYPQRFRAFYVLDEPTETWTSAKGRITQELLKTVLPEPKSENIKIFVCGPPGLYRAISGTKPSPADQGELSGYLKALGYSKDQVYKF